MADPKVINETPMGEMSCLRCEFGGLNPDCDQCGGTGQMEVTLREVAVNDPVVHLVTPPATYTVYEEGDPSVGIWGVNRDDMDIEELGLLIAEMMDLAADQQLGEFIDLIAQIATLQPGQTEDFYDMRVTRNS